MRVLITGMSGVGKSALTLELRGRGYAAYDADDDGFTEPRPDGAWGWRVEPIRALLDGHGDELVFLAGCSEEQTQVRFDFTVLLTAPHGIILERLRTRTTNSFGKTPTELDLVLAALRDVEPRLRDIADATVETTAPIADVADLVVQSVARRSSPL
jgi:dephospho-CoA kinase